MGFEWGLGRRAEILGGEKENEHKVAHGPEA